MKEDEPPACQGCQRRNPKAILAAAVPSFQQRAVEMLAARHAQCQHDLLILNNLTNTTWTQ